MGEGVDEPVARRHETLVGIDLLGGLGEAPLNVAPVGLAMSFPQWAGEHPSLPIGHGLLVELEEDPLAAILRSGHPGWPASSHQVHEPGPGVIDAIEVVDAGEAEDGVDLAQPVDGEDPVDPAGQYITLAG